MPNYYAHFKFGALVLSRLPEALGAALKGKREAFDLGCLGPDPLFFYRPLARHNAARSEALRMHREPARAVMERLRKAVEENVPMSRGYAAGFLCHLALDSACHGYVNQETARGGPSHMALEAGFDRLLMARDAFFTPRQAGFPKASRDIAVYEAGARAYEWADGEMLRRGYRAMALDARLLARLVGKGSERVSLELVKHMEGAVAETAEQVVKFLGGAPLDGWYDRDFHGN